MGLRRYPGAIHSAALPSDVLIEPCATPAGDVPVDGGVGGSLSEEALNSLPTPSVCPSDCLSRSRPRSIFSERPALVVSALAPQPFPPVFRPQFFLSIVQSRSAFAIVAHHEPQPLVQKLPFSCASHAILYLVARSLSFQILSPLRPVAALQVHLFSRLFWADLGPARSFQLADSRGSFAEHSVLAFLTVCVIFLFFACR